MVFQMIDTPTNEVVIKVVGVGGGGCNAVNHMMESDIEGVQFIGANTDMQALHALNAHIRIQLGVELTKGLGAGLNPEVGRQAAEENRNQIKEALTGANMIFLATSMGGGTGTGAVSIFAEIAKELGALTVAIVTRPFDYEGLNKQELTNEGIKELEKHVDSLIIIPNQKLSALNGNLAMDEVFRVADNVLLDAVQGITELITHPGLINIDFEDVKTIMSEGGPAIMGLGSASGENRAKEAMDKAIACPLLEIEGADLQGADNILVNITAVKVSLDEYREISNIINDFALKDATIKIGIAVNPEMGDEIKVTVVATGLSKTEARIPIQQVKQSVADANYSGMDKPAWIRNAKQKEQGKHFGLQSKTDTNTDYLDVPAFLRRQAD